MAPGRPRPAPPFTLPVPRRSRDSRSGTRRRPTGPRSPTSSIAPAAPTASTRCAAPTSWRRSTPTRRASSSPATCSWPRSRVSSSAMRWATALVRDGVLVAETFGAVAPEVRRRRIGSALYPRDAGPAGRRVRGRPATRAPRAPFLRPRGRGGRPRAPRRARVRPHPVRLRDAPPPDGCPAGAPATGGPRDAARHRGPVPRDLRRRQRGVRGPLGPSRARGGGLPGALPRSRHDPGDLVRGLGRRRRWPAS